MIPRRGRSFRRTRKHRRRHRRDWRQPINAIDREIERITEKEEAAEAESFFFQEQAAKHDFISFSWIVKSCAGNIGHHFPPDERFSQRWRAHELLRRGLVSGSFPGAFFLNLDRPGRTPIHPALIERLTTYRARPGDEDLYESIVDPLMTTIWAPRDECERWFAAVGLPWPSELGPPGVPAADFDTQHRPDDPYHRQQQPKDVEAAISPKLGVKRSSSAPNIKEFVLSYGQERIEKGRRPTLTDCREQWKVAGHIGHRELLDATFKLAFPTKLGRPKK